MEQIDIKDKSGAIQLTTLINEGCKRKFTLMKEDYIIVNMFVASQRYATKRAIERRNPLDGKSKVLRK